jgi:protein transport protein SEC24
LYPVYALCMLKSRVFRVGESSSDQRAFFLRLVRRMSVPQGVAFFYPKMISIHELPAEAGTTLLNGRIKLPHMIRTSIDRLNPAGIYLVGKFLVRFIL